MECRTIWKNVTDKNSQFFHEELSTGVSTSLTAMMEIIAARELYSTRLRAALLFLTILSQLTLIWEIFLCIWERFKSHLAEGKNLIERTLTS
jgi:hypothetical protein